MSLFASLSNETSWVNSTAEWLDAGGFPARLPVSWGLEHYWNLLFTRFTHFQICTVGSMSIQLVFYLLGCLPTIICQFIPFMHRYKVQKNKTVSYEDQIMCLKHVMLTKVVMFLPLVMVLYKVSGYFDVPYDFASIRPWYQYVPILLASLMIEDAYHYFMHRLLHHKSIYGYVHKIHHTFTSPIGMAAEYAHPIETIVLGTGFFIPCLIFTDHLVYFWLWLIVRVLEAADAHSGYMMPWNPVNWIPFWGGAEFHDFHHKNFEGNYASSFRYLDYLFGTDRQFKEFKSKEQQSAKKEKGL